VKKVWVWLRKWGWLVLLGLVGILTAILAAVLRSKDDGYIEKLNDSINRKVLEADAEYVYEVATAKAKDQHAVERIEAAATEPDPAHRREKIAALLTDL
jgi:hypothetical protein